MSQNQARLPEIWGLKEIQEYLHIGESRARRLVREKDFPKPILGPRNRRWIAERVIEYLERNSTSQHAQRHSKQPLFVIEDARPSRKVS